MNKAQQYLNDRGDVLLTRLRGLSFEELMRVSQQQEELRFGYLWKGYITTHVDSIDDHMVRVVVHGVLELRLLGNYINYIEGFRQRRDGSLEKLTDADYCEFD